MTKSSQNYSTWIPPSEDTLQLNVDGAVFADQQRVGMGCVVRNAKAEVRMAATNPEQFYSSPLEVELITIFWGLQLCLSQGVDTLQVAGKRLSCRS